MFTILFKNDSVKNKQDLLADDEESVKKSNIVIE